MKLAKGLCGGPLWRCRLSKLTDHRAFALLVQSITAYDDWCRRQMKVGRCESNGLSLSTLPSSGHLTMLTHRPLSIVAVHDGDAVYEIAVRPRHLFAS